MRWLIPLGLLLLLLTSVISCAAPEASQPSFPQSRPPESSSDEKALDALDTQTLLDIGYMSQID